MASTILKGLRVLVDTLNAYYDLVVVGSGFGSLFFIEGYRQRFPLARVAIIERGQYRDRAWQLEHEKNSDVDSRLLHTTRPGEKEWNYTIGFGGGLNCWWAQTPRFLPSDFRTKTLFGRGADWPLTYEELEPYYVTAEYRMGIAGDDAMARILPRSKPFPQPAHRVSTIDKLMIAAQPNFHVPIATARASKADDKRSACCSSARCDLCPIGAKFAAYNGFDYLLVDQGVDVLLNAAGCYIDHGNGLASAVRYWHDERLSSVRGDTIVLGANGIHSPAILLRSGIDDYWIGRGLHEQHSVQVEAYLDGLENFDGATVTTTLNYSLCDGPFRKDYAGTLLYFENRWPHGLRPEKGKWRMTLPLWLSIEDEPDAERRVGLDDKGEPLIIHPHVSAYALEGTRQAVEHLPRILAPLPVEKIVQRGVPIASHIQGSTRMGTSVENSVVDRGLIHHRIRNLLIVGSGAIPTSSTANPSLTTAALSLQAASTL